MKLWTALMSFIDKIKNLKSDHLSISSLKWDGSTSSLLPTCKNYINLLTLMACTKSGINNKPVIYGRQFMQTVYLQHSTRKEIKAKKTNPVILQKILETTMHGTGAVHASKNIHNIILPSTFCRHPCIQQIQNDPYKRC